MTTHPTPTGPSQPPPPPRDADLLVDEVLDEADRILAGPLPRLGEVVRDAERLGAQMIAVLGRQYDPASAPEGDVWACMSIADYQLAVAVSAVRTALAALRDLTERPLPVAGSAIRTTPLAGGEEPTPGSAAVGEAAARTSDGGLTPPVAGASSGPSPRRDDDTPPGGDVRRGAGPGYLGSTQP